MNWDILGKIAFQSPNFKFWKNTIFGVLFVINLYLKRGQNRQKMTIY